jgi:hypothetical protein
MNPIIDLSHYTTIETLSLILKNRTIRFNSLSRVDDPREGETIDYGNMGHTILVSCWEESKNESIAMWKMYGGNYSGCIIKMPSNMFKNYKMGYYENRKVDENLVKEKCFRIYEDKNICITTIINDLVKIIYTDDLQCRYINELPNGDTSLNDLFIASHKSSDWSFQHEWRFILEQYPLPRGGNFFIGNELEQGLIDKTIYKDYYDLKIDNEIFEKMEIILGPWCNDKHVAVLESLIKCYNENCKYSFSKIMITQRQ